MHRRLDRPAGEWWPRRGSDRPDGSALAARAADGQQPKAKAADKEGMTPFGPYYPLILQAVMNHAERLAELLARREQGQPTPDGGGAWLIGRAAELRCIAGIVAIDWHEGRLSAEAAACKLARYVRELHDGLAMHLDVAMPGCCRGRAEAPRPFGKGTLGRRTQPLTGAADGAGKRRE